MTAAYNHILYMLGCEITASSSENFVKTHRKRFTNLVAHLRMRRRVSECVSKKASLSLSFLVVDVL